MISDSKATRNTFGYFFQTSQFLLLNFQQFFRLYSDYARLNKKFGQVSRWYFEKLVISADFVKVSNPAPQLLTGSAVTHSAGVDY